MAEEGVAVYDRGRSRKGLLLSVWLLSVFLCHTAAAEDVIRFDIPAQPLSKAIEVYSASGGVQVLYDSALAAHRRSTAVRGAYAPLTALQQLLEGTDLVAQRTESDDVVLVPAGTQADMTRPAIGPGDQILVLDTLKVADSSDRSYLAYVGVVEADIQKALHRDTHTRSGNYRVGLELWLAPDGTVTQSRVAQSTGDAGRDGAIVAALGSLVISQPPPPDMPQPVGIRIMAHSQ